MKSLSPTKFISLGAALTSYVCADTPDSAILTDYNSSGYYLYLETTPNTLTGSVDLAELVPALAGDASHAGGNVELYSQSENPTQANFTEFGAFANAQHVNLTMTFGGNQLVISSLNGNDWFKTGAGVYDLTYGADNLANQWFGDFVAELNGFPDNQKENLFDTYRDSGGFQQISDPNISFVEVNGTNYNVALGGFLDVKDKIVTLASAATGLTEAQVAPLIPDGLQVSEAVLIDGEAYYSFNAVASDVVYTPDGSYDGTYIISTPEPSSTALLGMGMLGFLIRRKR